MDTHTYLTDLSDAEWRVVQPLLPSEAKTGRPRQHPLRTIVNAIVYVLRAGCAWRLLPREFPPWKTVFHYFRKWRVDRTWERVHLALRQQVRIQLGRDPEPSAGSIDSQSVKTLMGGLRGYDGNKQLVDRKRHLLVDTQGFLLSVVVHPASIPDRAGGQRVLAAVGDAFPRLQHIWVDQGYTGTLVRWAAQEYGWTVQVVYPSDRQLKRSAPDVLADLGNKPGFRVIPKRWIVERTFSWIGRQRRLSKDYEWLTSTEEAFIYLVGIRLLLARLAPS